MTALKTIKSQEPVSYYIIMYPPRHHSVSYSSGRASAAYDSRQVPVYQGPPPGTDPQLWKYFSAVGLFVSLVGFDEDN